jgi:hypothetical protein
MTAAPLRRIEGTAKCNVIAALGSNVTDGPTG